MTKITRQAPALNIDSILPQADPINQGATMQWLIRPATFVMPVT